MGNGKSESSGLKYTDLKDIAEARLKEAEILCENTCYDGAVYLGGYVVETALKACICKKLEIDAYLDQGAVAASFKTHNLSQLITLAGLRKKLTEETASNTVFYSNWATIKKWSEIKRYEPIGTNKKDEAEDFISALNNPEGGVLAWIKRFW